MANNNNLTVELVERVFCSRNYSHFAHWKTKSYAEHEALGGFYDDVIEAVDSFIEKYQAAFGLVNFTKEEKDDKEEEKEEAFDGDILSHLQDDVKWINKNRSQICREVASLENYLDEVVGVYLQTIYKLRFLS